MQQPSQPAPQKPVKIDASEQKTGGDINDIMRRLRILEERYSNLRKKNQLTDQNMIDDAKRMNDEIRVMQHTISELKKDVQEVNSKIKLLTEEMGQSVTKSEMNLLAKYLEFWEPMEFIRKEEAQKIIQDVVDELRKAR